MNQSIIFSDQVQWNESRQLIEFHGQQAGMLVRCFISLVKLSELLELDNVIETDRAISAFGEARFDIEEIAEDMVDDEEFNPQGEIILG